MSDRRTSFGNGEGDKRFLTFQTDVESQDVSILKVALAYPGGERHDRAPTPKRAGSPTLTI